jgi:hypothetical protein
LFLLVRLLAYYLSKSGTEHLPPDEFKPPSESIKPMIQQIAGTCGLALKPIESRWKHGVYPLYYLYAAENPETTADVCN